MTDPDPTLDPFDAEVRAEMAAEVDEGDEILDRRRPTRTRTRTSRRARSRTSACRCRCWPSDALDLLTRGELTLVGRLWASTNNAMLCVASLPGAGEGGAGSRPRAIYKPVLGERPLGDFPDGTLGRREVAAFAVSRATGWSTLDPAYPAQRLAWILEDLQAGPEPPVILTQRRLLPKLEGMAARTVCLDEAWNDQEMGEGAEPLPADIADIGNLAYLIYTSGSTGRPKGVAIEHRERRGPGALGARSVLGRGAGRRARRDLDLLRPLGLRALRAARPRRQVILAENALELPALPAPGEVTLVNTVPSAIAELVRVGGLPGLGAHGQPGAASRCRAALVDGIYGRRRSSGCSTSTARPRTRPTRPASRCRAEERRAPTIGRPLAGTRAYVLGPAPGAGAAGRPGRAVPRRRRAWRAATSAGRS